MTGSNAIEIVEEYLTAIESRDFERARQYLADEGFVYRSPLGTVEDPDAFIADISRVGPIMKSIERHRSFVDGNDVCLILGVSTTIQELAHTRLAQWMSIEGGKIKTIEVFFDARAYARMFEA